MRWKLAIAFAAALIAIAVASLTALRTPWAGRRLCALAATRVRAATGLAVSAGACRVDPFRLEVSARDVRVGPADAPVLQAEELRVRLAPIQALGRRLELRDLELVRPRVRAALPAPRAGEPAGRCPPPLLERFGVQRLAVTDGALDLRLPGGERIAVGHFTVRSVPAAHRRGLGALSAPLARRTGLELAIAQARVDLGSRAMAVDDALFEGDVALDLSRLDVYRAEVHGAGVSLSASGAVEELCRPRLDLQATARGELPAILALLGGTGDAAGSAAAQLSLTGLASSPRVTGDVRLAGARIGRFRPGDARARIRLDGPELRVDEIGLPTQGGWVLARATLRFGREVALEADAQLDRVELGEVFERLGLPGAWVMMRLSGRTRVAGTAWPLRLEGDASLDFSDFRTLDHAWDRWRAGERAILDVSRGRLEGKVHVTRDGVRIASATLRAGAGVPPLSASAMLHFDGDRGFEVRAQGGADLSLLRHIGPLPIAGKASVEDVVVRAAPYGNPHIEGRARVQGLHFLDLDLGDAAARLNYDDLVLRVEGVEGRRGRTRYDALAVVDLGKSPVRVTESHFAAEGRIRDLFEAAMPWQPDARYARDALDGAVRVSGTARGPAVALDTDFEGDLGSGVLAGRAFDAGRFAGLVEAGARVVFDRAELTRAGGSVRGSGRVAFEAPFPWYFQLSFTSMPLADLGLPGAAWTGTIGGRGAMSGSWEDPVVHLAAEADGVGVLDVPVGAVKLAASLERGAIEVTGAAEGVRVRASARAEGDVPFEAHADFDLEDVARYAPGGPPAGLHARVRGKGSARGTLADVARASAELSLDEVHGGYGDFRVDASPPVAVAVQAGRVVLRPVTVTGANTSFVVEGARERSGELALSAKGALDLRLLAGLLPGVAEPRGQLAVEAHVGGTVSDPLLVGRGALRDGAFRVRNAPVAFAGVGGELAFSQNRMVFDHLDATVNGGRAEFQGEIELAHLRPSRVQVAGSVEEVPLRIPDWLPCVVSGDLRAAGTWDDMLLSGRLHVLRARYTEPVNLEKSVIEVRRKRPAARPFDPADAWLRLDVGLLVDGDARIENDLVRGSAKGELTLTGSLASVGLLGSLALGEGSRATFRGNEFALSHAVVDFTDRFSIRMRLDVHGDTRVRDYQIFMHLFGAYPEPALQLTSQPALSQEDIVTLLSLGFTTRDAAAGSGVTGAATAAAAQALFSASGLDDQVRRFVPRGKLLRDFSVRITSAYSEGAGQVEPRAELESRVLDERLRLRYQAPLSGARGQRAQAEVQLTPRTSLQYQWDNDTPGVGASGDHGLDLKLRWEWND